MTNSSIRGAIMTVLALFGGLALGLLAGSLTFKLLPGSSVNDVKLGHAAIAAVPALAGFLAGGAIWGISIGRLAGAYDPIRMAWAGTLGFGPITIILAVCLGIAEPLLVTQFSLVGLPIHRVFTLLFVPSAFLIAGTSAWAVGKGLKEEHITWSLFWQVGTAAALTFLAVNLTMESLGWVVGSPGAAERATMLTVLASGNICAALVAGGLLGWKISQISNKK